jgi:hypothetical protein
MPNTYKVLGQITTASSSIAAINKELSASVVTITTASAHGIPVGQNILISDASDITYNVAAKSLSASVATLTLSTAPRFTVGSSVAVSSVDATFNGSYTLTNVSGLNISYVKNAANVASASSTGVVTGKDIAFNGTYTVTSASTSTFSYVYNGASVSSTPMTGTVIYYPWINVYTCPAATSAVTSTLVVTNRGAASASYQIAVADSLTPSAKHYIVYNDLIAGYDTITMTLGLTLDSTVKYLLFTGSDPDLSFNVFGMEIS